MLHASLSKLGIIDWFGQIIKVTVQKKIYLPISTFALRFENSSSQEANKFMLLFRTISKWIHVGSMDMMSVLGGYSFLCLFYVGN
jgi:hypothetical protein